ncbi:unnamed protein product [Tuber melanosporum]|uniref:(Perigord truffle) hypothetical protein n=1 Tax=Tuber melanosporum (strain Mel28) TaxID=656061 RepID=D5GPB5_TUBMM|nr:uncharacterized protein GSTUM_00011789001 [Tuber melanosporum]CAZ86380.1 unnamed protein product [Tuber melanosporum]
MRFSYLFFFFFGIKKFADFIPYGKFQGFSWNAADVVGGWEHNLRIARVESGVFTLGQWSTCSAGYPRWGLFVSLGGESKGEYHTSIRFGLVGSSVVDVIRLCL